MPPLAIHSVGRGVAYAVVLPVACMTKYFSTVRSRESWRGPPAGEHLERMSSI